MSSSAEFHSGLASPRNKAKFRNKSKASQPAPAFSQGWEPLHSPLSNHNRLGAGHPPAEVLPRRSRVPTLEAPRYLSAGGGGDGQAVGQQPSCLVLFDQLHGNHRDHNLQGKTKYTGTGRDLTIIITTQATQGFSISLFFIKGHSIPRTLISAQRWFLLNQNNEDASSRESPIARAPTCKPGEG